MGQPALVYSSPPSLSTPDSPALPAASHTSIETSKPQPLPESSTSGPPFGLRVCTLVAQLTLRAGLGELGGPGNEGRLLGQVFPDPGCLECDAMQASQAGTCLWSVAASLHGGDTARAWVSLAARECRNVTSDTFSFLVEDRFACHQAHCMNTGRCSELLASEKRQGPPGCFRSWLLCMANLAVHRR